VLTLKRFTIVATLLGLLTASGAAVAWGPSWHERGHSRYSRSDGNPGPAHPLSQALPNRELTPGATNPAVTQATIHSTICVRGYTRSIRPPEKYTARLKRRQIREYGYLDRKAWHYEEDHLIGLEIGGSPTSPQNLWPEPRNVQGGWGSDTKDQLENRLNHLVCRGKMPLEEAQRMIASNWVAAYKRLISPTPLAYDPQDRY